MSNQYGHAQIVTDDLTFCVDANAVSSYPGSGSTWYDISEYGNNLTNNGATFNSAGYFDFASDRMEHWTSTAPGINGAFTVCGWISPDSFTSSNSYLSILNRSDSTTAGHLFSVFLSSSSGSGSYGTTGTMAAWVRNSAVASQTYTSSSVCLTTLAEWNFCVWRYKDGAGMTFDLFGSSGHVTNTQSTAITLLTDTSNQFTIGGWRGGSYFFDGKIANIAQYFRRLSDSEITQNFEAQRSRFKI